MLKTTTLERKYGSAQNMIHYCRSLTAEEEFSTMLTSLVICIYNLNKQNKSNCYYNLQINLAKLNQYSVMRSAVSKTNTINMCPDLQYFLTSLTYTGLIINMVSLEFLQTVRIKNSLAFLSI